jgi:hypothetical protein
VANYRWHGWVRTRNGQISQYVKIRAADAREAVEKAQKAAFKDSKDTKNLAGPPWRLEDFVVTGVSMHTPDTADLSA